MGKTGVRTLFSRALARAVTEVPLLRAVQVQADGSLARLDNIELQADPEALAKGSVALIAQLLGLLEAFVGENITLRMVREVWPKLALDDLHFRIEGNT